MVKGSCYCGAIEYEADLGDAAPDGILCHCMTCVKLHSISSYNIQSSQDKIKVTKGTPKVYDDKSADVGKTVHRNFCGDCGSALWSDPDSIPGVRFLKVGPLDNARDVKLAAEIYVDSGCNPAVHPKEQFGQKHFEGMMKKEV